MGRVQGLVVFHFTFFGGSSFRDIFSGTNFQLFSRSKGFLTVRSLSVLLSLSLSFMYNYFCGFSCYKYGLFSVYNCKSS